MAVCPQCKAVWPSDVERCPTDGASLKETPPAFQLRPARGPVAKHDEATVPERTTPSGLEPTLLRPEGDGKTELIAPGFSVDQLIGEQLGEYRVLSRLGSGGMGLVFRGVQPVIGKDVAIKVLKPEIAADADSMQRFLDEARAVNAIKHPAMVDIFSFGNLPNGAQYFVMELLEGETVEDLLDRAGALTAPHAVALLEQVAAGLEAAHGAGIIHRDLKPSNLFLVKGLEHRTHVKLLDFGLAKVAGTPSRQMSAQMAMGTPEYMSPEQATAQPLTPATDLFSLGAVAYRMLTGDDPFRGPTPMDTMANVVRQQPVPPRDRDGAIPVELETLVLRLLEKDAQHRPGSAREVRRELERMGQSMQAAQTRVQGAPREAVAARATAAPETVASAPTVRAAAPPRSGPGRYMVAGLAVAALALAGWLLLR